MSLAIDLQHRFGDFELQLKAELPTSGITALFGASGSGKTSLLRFIAGLERPDRGSITFNGQNWNTPQHCVSPAQRQVAYVFQEPSLFPHLKVYDNIVFSPRCQDEAEHWIERFELGALLTRDVTTLSGGEKQRVAIVRALASKPQLLLMDEPLSGLDEAAKQQLLPYIEGLRDELSIPVIFVSHHLSEVARLADHIVAMQHGRVIAQGAASDVLVNPNLPLAHGSEAGSVLRCSAITTDAKAGITRLETAAGCLSIPSDGSTTSRNKPRLYIAARDVSISRSRAEDSSILNIMPVTITGISAESDSQVLLTLQANAATLLARVSRHSCESLDLETGQQVYAQIKGVALFR